MTKLLTSNYKLDLAKRLTNSINNASNTAYYLYVSDHMDSDTNQTLVDTNDQKNNKLYNSMLFGKKITTEDAKLVIKNVPYEENKVYKMYEHDVELADTDFYCVVDEESYVHVYKCLDNNFNSPSSVKPDFAFFQSSENFTARLNDGYLWKYMYSVSKTISDKFSISGFFPLEANSQVSMETKNGTVDVIKIIDLGKGYNNYTNGTFSSTDLRINGNQKRYKINKTSANGYLNDCLIYLTAGTGVGQYANIVTYFSNANGNFIDIDREFDVAPQNQDQYEITPKINILSNGRETSAAIARALVNAYSSNSIYRIEMLETGENYEFATAKVSANVNVGVERNASLKLIYSPYGGHGKNSEIELYATRTCFSVKLENSEANTIPVKNNYKQIGIIKDPLFGRTNFELKDSSSTFITDEKIYKFNPVRLATNATMVELTKIISVTDADFQTQLKPGEYVYLKGPNNSDHQLAVVNTVINSTSFNIKSNATFSCTNGYIYYANTSSSAYVLYQPDAFNTLINSIAGVFSTDDTIIGSLSGCKATIDSISRSDTVKNFNTFIQMYRYEGVKNSGSFVEDDILYQGDNLANSTANATLHSFTLNGDNMTFYVSNQRGEFNLAKPVFGTSNAGICSINTVYAPELIYGSGETLYIDNIDPITRQEDQNEQFKIVFEF